MTWYLAPSLAAMREEADVMAPGRSRQSDGTVGDAAHASRTSDHNPKPDGSGRLVVDAIDLTHDPGKGFDVHALLRQVAAHGDQRVKYLISNRQIWNPSSAAWATYSALRNQGHSRLEAARMALPGWQPYSGSNPHTAHGHTSVKATTWARTHRESWFGFEPTPIPEEAEVAYRYSHDGKIWTTDFVVTQHWENGGPGFDAMVGNTKDLGNMPREFHESLLPGSKIVDAVNYGVDNQQRLIAVEQKLDQLLSQQP